MPSCTSMCVVPALCSDGRYRVGYVGVEVGPGKYDLSEVRCGLVGVPKPVAPAVAGLVPGACVALSHHGVRVNFVLVAHISGSSWFCSTGGRSFGETIVPGTAWHNDFCFQKDLARDAWDEACRPKRRVAPRVKVDSLRSLLLEFPVAFDALVAQKTWEAEVLRAQADRQLDVATASSMYESNPFVFVAYPKWRGEGRLSQLQVEFVWCWCEAGVPRFERVQVRLDDAVGSEVPLPEGLVVDYVLRQRFERAVVRESKRSCCPCKCFGLQTDTGYEPDPARWQLTDGWKSHQ